MIKINAKELEAEKIHPILLFIMTCRTFRKAITSILKLKIKFEIKNLV